MKENRNVIIGFSILFACVIAIVVIAANTHKQQQPVVTATTTAATSTATATPAPQYNYYVSFGSEKGNGAINISSPTPVTTMQQIGQMVTYIESQTQTKQVVILDYHLIQQ